MISDKLSAMSYQLVFVAMILILSQYHKQHPGSINQTSQNQTSDINTSYTLHLTSYIEITLNYELEQTGLE